jgi:tRNA G10  N-methylase Trm11
MQLAYIFGRTPLLARKELEVTATILPFRWSLSSVQSDVARLKPALELNGNDADGSSFLSLKDPKVKAALLALQDRLGGTTRTVYLHKEVARQDIQAEFLRMIESMYPDIEGKLTFGISVWGNGVQPIHVVKGLKKELQKNGQSVRFVVPQLGYKSLSSAQVLHNNLAFFPDEGKKMELVCIQEGKHWWIGCTLTVQDIENYTKRDFSIPEPDPVSGMLSPKLAQSMINLAVEGKDATIYDPFCGNGRILLESWYMGVTAYGSDIVEKKVDSAQKNLAWMASEYNLPIPDPTNLVWQMDATSPESLPKTHPMKSLWHIVGEPYLGRPLRNQLTTNEAPDWLAELTPLYLNFFKLWSTATHRPDSMLMVIPRAKVMGGGEASVFEQIVDRLREIGYTPEVLFCYDRPDSYVRRDLVRISYTK